MVHLGFGGQYVPEGGDQSPYPSGTNTATYTNSVTTNDMVESRKISITYAQPPNGPPNGPPHGPPPNGPPPDGHPHGPPPSGPPPTDGTASSTTTAAST